MGCDVSKPDPICISATCPNCQNCHHQTGPWNANIKAGLAWRAFLDEEGVRKRDICPAMEIWAINTLCYGDEMAPRMTAIGCGRAESSSRANSFCYRRLAAGKLIKKWKRSRGNRFLCGTQRGRRAAVCGTEWAAPPHFGLRKANRRTPQLPAVIFRVPRAWWRSL